MESYQECHVGCAPGTHAALMELILRDVPGRSGVLDIGAHSGALLRRLRDAGFVDLTGTDLDDTRFDVPDATFVHLDLNRAFATEIPRRFHLITATDVIEHLDSPRQFLTNARALLHDDGWLALSLPNVAFWEGRLKFLIKGELWGFGARNYRSQRHISPLTTEQMVLTMRELGLQVVARGTGGSFATGLRRLATFPVWGPIRLVGGPAALGESALYLAQRAEPDPDLTRPLHYRDRWQGIPDRLGIECER